MGDMSKFERFFAKMSLQYTLRIYFLTPLKIFYSSQPTSVIPAS